MGMRIARLLLALGATATLAACDGGDTGKTLAPQATAAATPTAVAAKLNVIDRSHAGTPAPDVPFEWHGGEAVRVADFAGQKVLVNLWATWWSGFSHYTSLIFAIPSLNLRAPEFQVEAVGAHGEQTGA
jgi:hypothetical protein